MLADFVEQAAYMAAPFLRFVRYLFYAVCSPTRLSALVEPFLSNSEKNDHNNFLTPLAMLRMELQAGRQACLVPDRKSVV